MKYRIASTSKVEFDIITEDGGIASVHHDGDNFITTYFQSRLTEVSNLGDLSQGKAFIKQWEDDIERDVIIRHALSWLVFPAPLDWEIDNSLFKHIL
jgi:hypothetical protein